jgi:hypothetical protein
MLTSFFALQHSIEKLSDALKELKDVKGTHDKKRMYTTVIGFILALLFFMVELYLLFYLLKYVYKTSSGTGRNVRVILLVFFTMPFALLAATTDPSFASSINRA